MKLPQISQIRKNHNFSSIIGTFETNCFYPINFVAGTCEEFSFSFLQVVVVGRRGMTDLKLPNSGLQGGK